MNAVKMNPEVKEKWVAALESGEYRQGREYLNRKSNPEAEVEGGLCCLGVLCELAVEAGITTREEKDYLDHYVYGEHCTAYPPESVVKWAGLSHPNPFVTLSSGPFKNKEASQITLSTVNDNLRYDFNQIAAIIREQL